MKNATGFSAAETLDTKLHDFIVQLCGDGALLLVDTKELRGRGFEAWRRLKKRYAPTGGAYDLDALASLTDVSACKDLASLPDALARWERKVESWERQSSERFPENLKIPLFLKMLPKAQRDALRWMFEQGNRKYDTLVSSVLTYAQTLHFEGSFGSGDSDAMIDAVAAEIQEQSRAPEAR